MANPKAQPSAAAPNAPSAPGPLAPAGPSGASHKPMESSISVERSFKVEGQRVTVQVTLPATLAKEIGMDAMLTAAQKLLVTLDSKEAKITPLRMGQG